MKNETFETRIYTGNKYVECGETQSLQEASKLKHPQHTEQCTWDDIEDGLHKGSYSVIFCYRNDEHYNDLYFIHSTNN